MRILLTCCPLYGHVNVLLATALAARRAGHDVVLATGADMRRHVENHGVVAWPVGPTHAEAGGSKQASWLQYFGATALKRAAELRRRIDDWRPDVVIADETELAGGAIAAACEARLVVHGLGLMPPMRIWTPFAAASAQVAASIGVADTAHTLQHATYWHRCPAALQLPQDS